MSTNADLATRLGGALSLAHAPVALSFHDSAPPGVASFSGTVPAGCAFWERGMSATFATATADHLLCSIGVHTHNLAGAPESQARELADTLAAMTGLDYVREAEVKAIPTMPKQHRHVVYGPLAEHPVAPDVVLLFANARQALVLSEAVQRVDGGTPPAMGRPACALIPQVVTGGAGGMSLGCCGARVYLGRTLTDDVALWGLPGAKLALYAKAIETLAKANTTLTVFHERRAQDVEQGARPAVRESLARLTAS
jgi:uncharacterized protein (DUF169 family)